MRGLNLMNDKKRDAVVAFSPTAKRPKIKMILADGREKKNIQFVKTTGAYDALLRRYHSSEAVADALVKEDPELDIETTGRLISGTHTVYLDSKGGTAYHVRLVQVIRNPDGSEKERREALKSAANINVDMPVRLSGREYPKAEALRNFVFTRNYQLRHTSGLTYDFLYDMAKQLHERGVLMFVGTGAKGTGPIVLSLGGTPYRGFLEGRIEGRKYALILHLTNMELKTL
jgi:hypothetical protein